MITILIYIIHICIYKKITILLGEVISSNLCFQLNGNTRQCFLVQSFSSKTKNPPHLEYSG